MDTTWVGGGMEQNGTEQKKKTLWRVGDSIREQTNNQEIRTS
jgi:hypothetical protein